MKDVINQHSEREIYLDILRIMATFAVIIIHIAAQNWHKVDINSYEWKAFNIYDSIARWSVPVFVMISGALFLNKTQSIKKIYKKYILRIITAFGFWSFFYAVIAFFNGSDFKSAIYSFIIGNYHMWFLYMIVGIYIITPLIGEITKNDLLTKYFIIISLLFAVIIPNFISTISIINSNLGDFTQSIINKINLQMVLGYTIYYILGYYLSKKDISRTASKFIYYLGGLGFILTIFLTYIISQYKGKANGVFYDYFSLNVLLESLCVFVVIKKIFKYKIINDKIKNIIYLLSKYSFGVYLIHPFIIDVLNKTININSLSFNAIIAVPIVSIIVFCISFLISSILNKIPILKKYIV